MKWSFSKTFIVFIFLLGVHVCAQQKNIGKITGSVFDGSTKKPLEFVNIALISLKDSSVVTGTTTDKNGNFEINTVPEGKYFLTFSFIGYKQVESERFSIDAKNKNENLGKVSLKPVEINLDEVNVTANKVMLSNSIDRKTYNVQQDILSKTGTASDLLQNIPSVEVDIDGNVSLRGSTDVLILINDKTSPLMGKTRAEVLQTMPASSIDKIEVITNPSAKYKPDGTAGIINIILKKDSNIGLNGGITGNYGNQGRYNGNINLNYNPGDFNIFGRYSLRKDNRIGFSNGTRTKIDSASGTPSYYRDNSTSNSRPLSHSVIFGFDYNPDKTNSFGISGDYFYRGFIRNDGSNQTYLNSANTVTEEYDRLRYDDEYEKEGAVTAYAEHKFPEEDHKIRLDFDWSTSP